MPEPPNAATDLRSAVSSVPVSTVPVSTVPVSTVPVPSTPAARPQSQSPPPSPVTAQPIHQLLARPDSDRAREHRYRFGQAVVFGLPVIALELWGHGLGGREAGWWVGVLQALLSGWVVYVAATGMLFEGLLLLHARSRWTGGLLVGAAAAVLYMLSVIPLVRLLLGSHTFVGMMFHWVVAILAGWSALQWWRLARGARHLVARNGR
jgi:cation transport ATPase